MERLPHLPHLLAILIVSVFFCAAPAQAAVTAQLPYLDPPRPEHFESIVLKVKGLPAAFRGKTIRLQDARGGLRFARSIEGWAGSAAAPEQTIVMPLPLVAAADLPRDRWPVIVTLVAADGAEIRELVDVPLPPVGPAGTARRVLLVSGGGGAGDAGNPIAATSAADPAANLQPAVTASLSEADFLQSPALALAAFDVVALDAHAASFLSQEQLAGLLNAGLRVVVQQAEAPAGGLGRFIWDRLPTDPALPPRWVTPREPVRHPRVIEPALMQARSLQVQADAPSGLRRILLSVAPVGILLVVLARLLIRRSTMLLGLVTAALTVWTGVAIACATLQLSPAKSTAAWLTRDAPPVTPATPFGGSAVALRESFTASSSLLPRDLDLIARPGEMLWPAAANPHQYFALDSAELLLDYAAGGHRVERLAMPVPARFGIVIARRSLRPMALLPAPPATTEEARPWATRAGLDLTDAWQLEAGYITPAVHTEQVPRLFPQWLSDSPENQDLAPAAACWFALRFDGRHRYLIARQPVSGPSAPELLIIDCGPSPPATISVRSPSPGSSP